MITRRILRQYASSVSACSASARLTRSTFDFAFNHAAQPANNFLCDAPSLMGETL